MKKYYPEPPPPEYVIEEIFRSFQPGLHCEDCDNLQVTQDANATGDSPTAYDCHGDADHCPIVDGIVINMAHIITGG